MRVQIPNWYLLALLHAVFASSGRAASLASRSIKLYVRDDDDDGDDSDSDDGDDSGHARHHGGSASSSHGLSKGAMVGIVIGCLIALLLLFLFVVCCIRRRRAKARKQAQAAAVTAAAPEMKENLASTPLLVQHPPNLRPRSTIASSPTDIIPGPLYFSDSIGRRATQEYRNVAPPTDDSAPLPNPYDGDTPPQPPTRDDFLSSPTSPSYPTSPYASSASRISRRQSTAPSAWTHDELHSDASSGSGSGALLLARGGTQTSRLTTSSCLHEEIAGYQKALEAHYRKESEDAVMREHRIGEGSSVPADPPPMYSPSVEN
ncbi:hypothetical protein BD309DRAFT_960755 [Dichomitus squalens]|uniref:Uncharacterized protein n=1 Tax=Dichomitus squalens TaxID=114155 RepID=A0A4Q9QCW8_9APHY|nr:hypothetical protein BD309DRAFT_960755 [Dichomitus squalens]TBU64564.1 hypothetical protein BD310DRAFT_867630 [Dichomitus squalens]